MLRGLMMDRPLLVSSLIEHAARYYGDTEIVSRTVEGPIHRYTYADARRRAKQLAAALRRLGMRPGDRIGTLGWNGFRHFELYYGISGIGLVCHTINPRLFTDQITYIINHAADRLLFVDLTFVPLVEKLANQLHPIEAVVIMTDRAHMPATSLPKVLCYEDLVAAEPDDLEWPEFDENDASSLCYTSGTTGNPKGVLYSHRSTVLHGLVTSLAMEMTNRDVICPIVPMFHANAWAIPYLAPMCGAKLVLPGLALDGASLHALFEAEGVTSTSGVPTVWLGLLRHMDDNQLRFSTLKRLLVGGSAVPLAMLKSFEETYGVRATHGWGMTELSPVGSLVMLSGKLLDLPKERQYEYKLKQGRALYCVDMKLVDAEGRAVPHDGVARGELLVRGPWVISGYYNDAQATEAAFDKDGWFRTGDVCTIDAEGFLQVVDRHKDVIKSGGEWISSIDIENMMIGHPDVAEAAVIGLPHPKWAERPLLIVVPKEGRTPTREALLDFLSERLAKWMLPDDVVFVPELPHTATGKLQKTKLREQFRDYKLPTV
jgi:acyl-CoA synthetase (AMP-forming)/AMP-acid ligase II